MTTWQLQTAKARLSELIRTARDKGPQAITLHGREEAVVISRKDYERMRKSKPDLVSFFRNSPFHGVHLNLRRNRSLSRRTDV